MIKSKILYDALPFRQRAFYRPDLFQQRHALQIYIIPIKTWWGDRDVLAFAIHMNRVRSVSMNPCVISGPLEILFLSHHRFRTTHEFLWGFWHVFHLNTSELRRLQIDWLFSRHSSRRSVHMRFRLQSHCVIRHANFAVQRCGGSLKLVGGGMLGEAALIEQIKTVAAFDDVGCCGSFHVNWNLHKGIFGGWLFLLFLGGEVLLLLVLLGIFHHETVRIWLRRLEKLVGLLLLDHK